MPPEDNLDNLPWFHQLTVDEQVHLISHPSSYLSDELIGKLSSLPELITWTRWEGNPAEATLGGDHANRLRQQRKQLDSWFDKLSAADSDYVIQHRAGRLEKEYLHKVTAADGPALRVLIDGDAEDDYSFELPPFVRAYLEYRIR